jgi:uncharacterized Zn-binding protein involved in type VI secretion
MPGIARVGDLLSPHGCWTPHVMASGSGNVIVNGIPACKVGDAVTVHCEPCSRSKPCHSSVQASGASTVLINGMPAARISDSIACGSTNAQGSGNVIA